jgi:signal transduction histidine kinase
VQGYLELIQKSGELNEKQQYFYLRALAGLERMQNLVENIVDSVRLQESDIYHFADCDVRTVVGDTVDMLGGLAARREISLHLDMDSTLDPVRGDYSRLVQAMSNLLGNAIKFNHDGGHIWITAITQPEFIRVSVRDTGPGIPAEQLPYVFERFFRAAQPGKRRVDGSGLGLWITKLIIEQHRGRIWVESAPDAGSTFYVTLPRKRQPYADPEMHIDARLSVGEGHDSSAINHEETPIEASDSVDDNTQEGPASSGNDSTSDRV